MNSGYNWLGKFTLFQPHPSYQWVSSGQDKVFYTVLLWSLSTMTHIHGSEHEADCKSIEGVLFRNAFSIPVGKNKESISGIISSFNK